MTPGYPDSVAAWHAFAAEHAAELLAQPLAYAVAHMTQQVITEASAAIERLRSELDAYCGRQVLYCTDAQMDTAAAGARDVPPGTILRATDTGRELELARGGWWQPRDRA